MGKITGDDGKVVEWGDDPPKIQPHLLPAGSFIQISFVNEHHGPITVDVDMTDAKHLYQPAPCQCNHCRPREPYSRAMLDRLLPALDELPITRESPLHREDQP